MKTWMQRIVVLALAGGMAAGSAEGAALRVGAEGEQILVVADCAGGIASAAGGLIQEAVELDVPVRVCLAAGGEAEMVAAVDVLEALGCPPDALECLGQPAGALPEIWAEHWGARAPLRSGEGWGTTSVPYEWAWRPGAAHAGEDVVEALAELMAEWGPTRILAAGTGPFAWEAARAAGLKAEVLAAAGGRYGGAGELAFPVAGFQMEPKREALRAAGEAGVARKREEWRKLDARAGGEELEGSGRIAGWKVERTQEGSVAFRAECTEKLGGRWAVRWRIWATGGATPFAEQPKILVEARRGQVYAKDLRTGKNVEAACLGWGGTAEVVTVPEAALGGASQAWVSLELLEGEDVLDRTGWERVDWSVRARGGDDGDRPVVWDGGGQKGAGLTPKVRMPGRTAGSAAGRTLTPVAVPAAADPAKAPSAVPAAKPKAPAEKEKSRRAATPRGEDDYNAPIRW